MGACNIKRHVPSNQYLLVSNKVELPKGTEIDKSSAENVIKQRTNHKAFWVYRFKLRLYNSIDSTKAANDKDRRIERYKLKNEKRIAREDRINEKRIQKALKKGETNYKPKYIALKDTIDPRPTMRERLKYNWGEPPVIYDSTLTEMSREQMELFAQKSGYFDAQVELETDLNPEKQEAKVVYRIVPGEKYMVDSMYVVTTNNTVRKEYQNFLKKGKNALKTPFRFDSNALGKMRRSMAEHMRNQGLYGFRESYITYEVDTLSKGYNITVAIEIAQRTIGKGEEEVEKPFAYTRVRNVNFHMLDTMSYKGSFYKEQLEPRGIVLSSHDEIPTFDTLRYDWYKGRNKQFRTATFLYNGRLTSKAELVEFQNYLEETNYYSGDFLPQSYNRLMNLNVFRTVKVEVEENEDNTIDVHYYLTPQKQRTFSFEPKATHNNSYLGLSASLNYVNRNLWRRGHRLKISVSGGFESSPDLFNQSSDLTKEEDFRPFNTFEYGPSAELELPGLFPIPLTKLSKRQNPQTSIALGYNFQSRSEFERQMIQWRYLWKFHDIYRTQSFTVGIPVIGGIEFVKIRKTPDFAARLEAQNDLFLLSAYSNQAVYKDLAVTYSYLNPEFLDGSFSINYNAMLDVAGMIVSLIKHKDPVNSEGYKEFLGQRYSQFVRLDNQVVFNHYVDNTSSVHYRIQAGAGMPVGNNGPSLPFDYSFFGGGANDNRGYSARTLGPGIYKYYLDTTRTRTQMGDIRLGASLEYRFKMSKMFEGALFSDVGNVWRIADDPNRPGGQITKDFYKELSVAAGLGLRLDFTFLIVRLDVGLPLRNPALPNGARWIFQSRDAFYQEGIDEWGINPETNDYFYKEYFPKPFRPRIHFGIGYPF